MGEDIKKKVDPSKRLESEDYKVPLIALSIVFSGILLGFCMLFVTIFFIDEVAPGTDRAARYRAIERVYNYRVDKVLALADGRFEIQIAIERVLDGRLRRFEIELMLFPSKIEIIELPRYPDLPNKGRIVLRVAAPVTKKNNLLELQIRFAGRTARIEDFSRRRKERLLIDLERASALESERSK